MANILEIKDLQISFAENKVVDNLTFQIPQGSRFALVGESGSGKSITCSAILGLLPANARVKGQIIFDSTNLLANTKIQKACRGKKIAYIPQNPITSLNPLKTVFAQFAETIKFHQPGLSNLEIKELCEETLSRLQFKKADFSRIMNSYSFELSGGMCQRIMIGLSLIFEPELILADEPTTALDVTIQAEIMNLLLALTKAQNLSLMLITHDLALVAQSCEYVSVLKEGQLQEAGLVKEVFTKPQSDYTATLLECATYN